ncbi:hypothetical protein [Pontiella sp.]|uniref:hypothetical protein n=1 Tax=Pontiella sp. TaxID=2837462 RepID=UPI0035661DD0
MKPILLIHGYSSEGADKPAPDIYKGFIRELRDMFGAHNVTELDLSRWISLNDGICIDDVSFAMDRALKTEFPHLLAGGFNVVIHSTGALVVRNWIKKFSPMPSPIINLVHLAGANFGSGLAHIGQGQIARWGKELLAGTGCGYRILDELEFGSWKTLDLHLHFLNDGTRMYEDYQVQEFCIIGSQVPKAMRVAPIRYVREDSSDSTVRVSGSNLNFNYISVKPTPAAYSLTQAKLAEVVDKRMEGKVVSDNYYRLEREVVTEARDTPKIPFTIPYEIAHSGDDMGIVTGEKHRAQLLRLVRMALETDPDVPGAYANVEKEFAQAQSVVFDTIARRRGLLSGWNLHSQYEGHAQWIFRIRDQEGRPVEHFDIYMNSKGKKNDVTVPNMIEHRHSNRHDKGTMVFYLRTQAFSKRRKKNPWKELLDDVLPLDLEITGEEPLSDDIEYVPLRVCMSPERLRRQLKSFQTTIVDVVLLRLPSAKVFNITPAP